MRAALSALIVLIFMAAPARALPAVDGVRIGLHGDVTRVVIDLDDRLDYVIFTLADPYRVVIDLPEVAWRVPRAMRRTRGGIVERFRYGLFRAGTSRLVFDLNAPVEIKRAFVLEPIANFRYRLVLDLAAVPAAAFRVVGSPEHSAVTVAAPIPVPPPPTKPGRAAGPPVIVIDPGHGGVDPGTIGVSGIYEKDITLAAGRELAALLRATGRYKVVLTRNRDVFVPLKERVAIGRRAGAALFISLHADSIADHGFKGAHVYTLSKEASDATAAELAAKENESDVIAGLDPAVTGDDPELASILIDLAQRVTKNDSQRFAGLLVPELARETRLVRKSIRSAGFRVLKAPDVPSVLVELGYLSNPEEERLLRDDRHRRRLMAAIARAVGRYIGEIRRADRS